MNENKSYFTRLLDDYPQSVYGGLFQLARHDCAKSQSLFDGTCCFRNDVWNSNNIADACDVLLKTASDVPFFRSDNGKAAMKALRDDAAGVLDCLIHEPEAVTRKGRTVMYLRESLIENASLFLDEREKGTLCDALENSICVNSLTEVGHGNYNTVYRLKLDRVNFRVPLAVRVSRREKVDFCKVNPYPFDIQLKTQGSIYESMAEANMRGMDLASVPVPLYVGGLGDHMVMEYVENSMWLERMPFEIPRDVYSPMRQRIKEVLENTLKFWETGNEGGLLFRHHDLHGGNVIVKYNSSSDFQVYIIDFDFSIFKPPAERANYSFVNEYNVLNRFNNLDTGILKLVE